MEGTWRAIRALPSRISLKTRLRPKAQLYIAAKKA
jgi:hypothetical protein